MIYSLVLTLHLFAAIFYLGFMFFDVFIYSNTKKYTLAKTHQEMKANIGKVSIKIMPLLALVLLLSGVYLFVSSSYGFIFHIKIALACVIFFIIIFSLFYRLVLKKPNPISKIAHKVILTCGILIVLIAKLYMYF